MFEFVSFVIGLLLGGIITLLLIWIAYFTRSFLFTYCATNADPPCAGADYYNNPGDALANGANINDILFLNDQNQLFYERVARVGSCTPQANQIVNVLYPQYCSFSTTGGITGIWKETAFNSNIYKPANGIPGPTITTTGNCIPTAGSPVDIGLPILKWDTNPISD